MRGAALIRPKLPPASRAGGFLFDGDSASKLLITPDRERVVLAAARGCPSLAHRTTTCLRPTCLRPARLPLTMRIVATALTPRFPAVWLFILAALVLPPLLAFIATALWLVWMCF